MFISVDELLIALSLMSHETRTKSGGSGKHRIATPTQGLIKMLEQRGVPTPGSVRTCNSGEHFVVSLAWGILVFCPQWGLVLCISSSVGSVQNSDIGAAGSQPIKYSSQVWCKLTFWRGRIQVDGLCTLVWLGESGQSCRPSQSQVMATWQGAAMMMFDVDQAYATS